MSKSASDFYKDRAAAITAGGVMSLDIAVGAFAEKLGILPGVVTEKLAFDLHSKITRRTPVDTGRARHSWQVQEGSPNSTVAPENPTGPPLDVSPFPEGKISGQAPVYITNALDYVVYLEAGTSRQAPAGMVKLAILEVQAEANAILKQLEDT